VLLAGPNALAMLGFTLPFWHIILDGTNIPLLEHLALSDRGYRAFLGLSDRGYARSWTRTSEKTSSMHSGE
jgi:hypothetical protein